MMQESESIKKGNMGRKPKHDYTSEEFLSQVESYAKKGFTDKEIAYAVNIEPETFSRKKSEFSQLRQVLSRGRAQINAAVRAKFLAVALGGVKTKSTIKRKLRMADGTLTDDEEIQTSETELAPSLQAMSTWLYHHDEEWRKVERNLEEEDIPSDIEHGVNVDSWIKDLVKK